MPSRIFVVAMIWTMVLVAAFVLYERVDAVSDFLPHKLGDLPVASIWFGAVGGLLISLEGIFEHNRKWSHSYDYWHYMRPVVGAIMGTLGCLVFIVLAEAAASKGKVATPNPVFYDVIALGIGYREASFRALIARLIDTVILPSNQKSPTKTPTDKTTVGEGTA
jgi:hypothetical protein